MSEQQLNSLERFRKHSSRLVLEEHSHCEVPAGCGGVVIRWRNPLRTIALHVHLYCPGKAKLFLDGAEVETSGVDVAPGIHQLAVALEDVDLAGGLFMFATRPQTTRVRRREEPTWLLVSEADRSWLASLDEPVSGDWKQPGYDDSKWIGLDRFLSRPTVNWREPGAHAAHWCNEYHAAFLALPPGSTGRGNVWVRKRFDLPQLDTP